MKVTDAISYFQDTLTEQKKSTSTIRAYISDLRIMFEEIGSTEVVNNSLVRDIESRIKKEYESNQTRARKLNSLQGFISFLFKKKLIEKEYTIDFGSTSVLKDDPKFLTNHQINLLRTLYENSEQEVFIEMLLQTGIKLNELNSLHKKDINLKTTPTQIVLEDRILKLNRKAELLLKDWINKNKIGVKRSYLFVTKTGKINNIRNFRGKIKTVLEKISFSLSPNDIRNTFIKFQLEAGLPVDLVSKIVGHSNILTTRKYLDYLDDEYKETSLRIPVEI